VPPSSREATSRSAPTYLGFLGDADLSLKTNRLLTDRDQLSLVAKYSF
jgi:hypothetical protein